MARIGEVVTQNDLKSLAAYNAATLSKTVYVAPTVYKFSGSLAKSWIYYDNPTDALKQWMYVNNIKGSAAVKPKGTITFKSTAAETLGINVDFFMYHPVLGLVPAPYAWVRQYVYEKREFANLLFRFYKTDGSGPYYSVLIRDLLFIQALAYNNVPADKIQALQEFNSRVQMLKAKHNALASFVYDLSKKQKVGVEQQIFDESLYALINFQNQLRALKSIDIVWSTNGQISGPESIGIVPLVWVAIIAASSLIVVSGFKYLFDYLNVVKNLDSNFNMSKFIEQHKLAIAKAEYNKEISSDKAKELTKDSNKIQENLQKNIETVVQNTTEKKDDIFGSITKVLLIGGGLYIASKLIK